MVENYMLEIVTVVLVTTLCWRLKVTILKMSRNDFVGEFFHVINCSPTSLIGLQHKFVTNLGLVSDIRRQNRPVKNKTKLVCARLYGR